MGVTSISATQLESLAKKFLEEYSCEVLVVSLGAKGALWPIEKNGTYSSPNGTQKSTIGTGDSMVSGMVFSLQKEKYLRETIKYTVPNGTAATLRPCTQLCNK